MLPVKSEVFPQASPSSAKRPPDWVYQPACQSPEQFPKPCKPFGGSSLRLQLRKHSANNQDCSVHAPQYTGLNSCPSSPTFSACSIIVANGSNQNSTVPSGQFDILVLAFSGIASRPHTCEPAGCSSLRLPSRCQLGRSSGSAGGVRTREILDQPANIV